MSNKFCTQCGAANDLSAYFCNSCGEKFVRDPSSPPESRQSQPTTQQPPEYIPSSQKQPSYQQSTQYPPPSQASPSYQQPPQYAPGQPSYIPHRSYERHYGPDYVRPPDYVFTTTISERILGTLKRDVHVVEEIEEREDLQEEAIRLLILCFSVLSLLTIITVFSGSGYEVHSSIGTIFQIVSSRFIGGLTFISLVAYIGKSLGGYRTQVDRNEIIRVTSYAYVANVAVEVISLLFELTDNVFLAVLWLFMGIYFLLVMIFVIRRALDTGYFKAIITSILAVVLTFIVNIVIFIVITSIFGDTYDPPTS